ncbi:MAG: T9SS type A sorting domain-containing protein [Chitinophagales bacterium]|nr:T9SS type A sorting domain-containing protein [Chitinophagales bacterium]
MKINTINNLLFYPACPSIEMSTGADFKKTPEADFNIPKARLGKFRLSDAGKTVYPNIVNQNEAIHIDGMESETRIQVLSLDGKVLISDIVSAKDPFSKQLFLNIPSGLYIVDLQNTTNMMSSSHKILVK